MLQFLARPAASCGKPAVDPGDGLAFWASFGDGLDGWLSLGAFAVAPGTPPWPGRLAPEGASWTARGHTFSVSGSRGAEPAGVERVRALALALDPDFARACLLRDRLLVEADLPALGLRAARAPSAYVLAWSSLRAEELTGVCPPDLSYRGGVFLEWQFSDVTGRSIVAQASRGGAAASPSPEDPKGGEAYFTWTDAWGTSYSVYGYAAAGDAPSREDLLFVARSLDPSFAGA
jgi:hypothetical protein